MSHDIPTALANIIRKFSPKAELHARTCLFHDLSIAGDDAAELLGDVHKEFGTVFEGLEFERYFPNEAEAIFYRLASLVGYRGKKRTLTFGHLAAVVQLGRWFDPEAMQQVD